MIRSRLCVKCGEEKPITAFYRTRKNVCKDCLGERARRRYVVRTAFQDDFVCRQCGKPKRADQASSYASALCKSCHAANLLRKKAAAPDVLTCRVCGRALPKDQMERYSLTRCKECATKAVQKIQEERDE